MRGVIVWMAQDADARSGRPARAVAVEYDAERVALREAERGVLIVTNTSLVFGREARGGGEAHDGSKVCTRYKRLRELIDEREGSLDGSAALTTFDGVAMPNTLHVVHATPAAGVFKVWHGALPAQRGEPVTHKMP